MEEKEIKIERIVKRYIAMNESDYSKGLIDANVKEDCNNFAEAFGNILRGISDESVDKFYNASRNTQEKVFCYDSACWSASTMSRPYVEDCYDIVTSDMERYGLDKLDYVVEIMTPHLNNLKSVLDAEYIDLGNGMCAYVGLKGAMI